MSESKKMGFLFTPGFADWEYGLLAASAAEYFNVQVLSLTPDGLPVKSMAGFQLVSDRAAHPDANQDLDAIVVIGSKQWEAVDAPDMNPLMQSLVQRDAVVGGICAGTLVLARAGLFEQTAHTSNSRDWILNHLPNYVGSEHYRDVPYAVADGKVVSAPGSAAGTFTLEFLGALFPEKQAEINGLRAFFSKEYVHA